MKAILKQLKKQRENLVNQSTKRDEYYSRRSETWQDGAAGVIYECKTGELADVIEKLDETIEKLKDYLNDC